MPEKKTRNRRSPTYITSGIIRKNKSLVDGVNLSKTFFMYAAFFTMFPFLVKVARKHIEDRKRRKKKKKVLTFFLFMSP